MFGEEPRAMKTNETIINVPHAEFMPYKIASNFNASFSGAAAAVKNSDAWFVAAGLAG
jgi:hypothetical protein